MKILKDTYSIINDDGECIGQITKEHSDPDEFGNYYFEIGDEQCLLFEDELEFILNELKKINIVDRKHCHLE